MAWSERGFTHRTYRGRKLFSVETQEYVQLVVEEATIENIHGSCSIHDVSHPMEIPFNTEQKVVHKLVYYSSYKIRCIQHIHPIMQILLKWKLFHCISLHDWRLITVAVEFLEGGWSRFHLDGAVTHKTTGFRHTKSLTLSIIFHCIQAKSNTDSGFTVSFMSGPFFFEEPSMMVTITLSVTANGYASMLRRFVVPDIWQYGILDNSICIHNRAPPHVDAACVKLLLR